MHALMYQLLTAPRTLRTVTAILKGRYVYVGAGRVTFQMDAENQRACKNYLPLAINNSHSIRSLVIQPYLACVYWDIVQASSTQGDPRSLHTLLEGSETTASTPMGATLC